MRDSTRLRARLREPALNARQALPRALCFRPAGALYIRIGGEERGWTIFNLLTLDPETRPISVFVCSVAIQSLHEHQSWLDKFGIIALPKPFDLDMLLDIGEPDRGTRSRPDDRTRR